MITILRRLKYHYFPIYYVALYFFLINLSPKRYLDTVNNNTELNIIVTTYSPKDVRSKETKILLDLRYKNIMHVYPLDTRSVSCAIDLEGKILGHKTEYDQTFFSKVANTTISLNKKLLHSTLFGSIRLIKI